MSLGRCETCRFKVATSAGLSCRRIVPREDLSVPTEEVAISVESCLADTRLIVLPSFGCVLWEEP